jgi:thiol-disulfide isomerase/thioredoxin
MIDKLKTETYLRARRRINAALIVFFLGLAVLWGNTGLSHAAAVEEANAGKGGQTLDLKALPVPGKTTVLDFFSPYCPPCMALAPLLEQLAQKRADLVIKKVNIQRPEVSGHIDWQSPLAKQLSLHSIPHFMIFDRQGQTVSQGQEATKQVIGWLQEAGLLKK